MNGVLYHVKHQSTRRHDDGSVSVVFDTVPPFEPITITLDPPVADDELRTLEETHVLKILREGSEGGA